QWPARDALRSSLMDVVAVVTAFTVAHSITLALALTRVVEPPRAIVETLVALSVVLAALNNLMGWFALERWRMAFVFGLIHGFGFATALIDLNLPGSQLAVALGGFNIGVELGQLAIVAAFFPLAWWLRMTGFYRVVVVAGGSLIIAGIGTLWVLQRLGLMA
ncbi:MAG: HupE/UreJ family protein, partial [Hydrogenophaga sp.]|nr:HupE/UreJ family protein [Hydrogenophaga sp.]